MYKNLALCERAWISLNQAQMNIEGFEISFWVILIVSHCLRNRELIKIFLNYQYVLKIIQLFNNRMFLHWFQITVKIFWWRANSSWPLKNCFWPLINVFDSAWRARSDPKVSFVTKNLLVIEKFFTQPFPVLI